MRTSYIPVKCVPHDASYALEQVQVIVIGLAGQQAVKFAKPPDSSYVLAQDKVIVNGPAGQQAVKKTGGYGSRMVESLEKQGKPVDARMRQMANWMDSIDTGDDGQVLSS